MKFALATAKGIWSPHCVWNSERFQFKEFASLRRIRGGTLQVEADADSQFSDYESPSL